MPIDFNQVPLIDTLSFIQRVSGLTVRISFPDDLELAPITVKSEAITVRALLDDCARRTGISWRQDEQGVILVELVKVPDKAEPQKRKP